MRAPGTVSAAQFWSLLESAELPAAIARKAENREWGYACTAGSPRSANRPETLGRQDVGRIDGKVSDPLPYP